MVPKIIEIGLTSNCNLKCPLCTRNKIIFSKKDSFPKYRPNELDLNTLIEFIRYINPEEVKLVGAVGELAVVGEVGEGADLRSRSGSLRSQKQDSVRERAESGAPCAGRRPQGADHATARVEDLGDLEVAVQLQDAVADREGP